MKSKLWPVLAIFQIVLTSCVLGVGKDTYISESDAASAKVIFAVDEPRKIYAGYGYGSADVEYTVRNCGSKSGTIYVQLSPEYNNNNKQFYVPVDKQFNISAYIKTGTRTGKSELSFVPKQGVEYKVSTHLLERSMYLVNVYKKSSDGEWVEIKVERTEADDCR
jgi:hypothetical protein